MADKKSIVFRVLRGVSWFSCGYFVLLLRANLANAQSKPRGHDPASADEERVTGLPGSLVVDALKKAGRMQ